MQAWRRKSFAAIALAAMASGPTGLARTSAAQRTASDQESHEGDGGGVRTATPIKHVVVIIGENRTFDNVYGTYQPKHGQHVSNLLSRGIVRADGSPGPNSATATQFRLTTINPVRYFIDTNTLISPGKVAYSPFLPTPEAGSAPPQPVTRAQLQKDPAPAAPPFDASTFSFDQLHQISPVFEKKKDLRLLTTGATGLTNCTADPTEPPSSCQQPDTRVENFDALPNTVFPIVGRDLPYDAYSGDMVHRFFHMWQQSDCDIAHA